MSQKMLFKMISKKLLEPWQKNIILIQLKENRNYLKRLTRHTKFFLMNQLRDSMINLGSLVQQITLLLLIHMATKATIQVKIIDNKAIIEDINLSKDGRTKILESSLCIKYTDNNKIKVQEVNFLKPSDRNFKKCSNQQ